MKAILVMSLYVLGGWRIGPVNHVYNEHIPTEKRVDCITPISVNDDSLRFTLGKYIREVEDYEIPFVVEQSKGDSIMYFVSAFVYTNLIAKNPPAAINILGGREVLYYDGQGSISHDCQNVILNKYRKILHIDKLNEKDGLPPGTPRYYTHNPVWVKVTVVGDKVVDVTHRQTEKMPFINFSTD